MNPELDLSFDRVIQAPRSRVWDAWADPTTLASWWLPAPMIGRVDRLDLVAGGAFVTSMSEDGVDFVRHMDACFLLIETWERIVFTNAIDSGWRPAAPQPVAMTAEILLSDHPEGTSCTVLVRHRDDAARARHEELGFFEGWGAVTQQLADAAERAR